MFKLKADPTFKAKVAIPVPGGEPKNVIFIFKHRTRSGLNDWIADPKVKEMGDLDFLMEFVLGWEDVDAEFSRDALHTMIENFGGASTRIRDAYLAELTAARMGN